MTSARLRPMALTRRRTSPAAGCGSGTSSNWRTSGPPSVWKRTIRAVFADSVDIGYWMSAEARTHQAFWVGMGETPGKLTRPHLSWKHGLPYADHDMLWNARSSRLRRPPGAKSVRRLRRQQARHAAGTRLRCDASSPHPGTIAEWPRDGSCVDLSRYRPYDAAGQQ